MYYSVSHNALKLNVSNMCGGHSWADSKFSPINYSWRHCRDYEPTVAILRHGHVTRILTYVIRVITRTDDMS